MSNKDLNDTLAAIGRTPGKFYRDTGMILAALDRIEEIKANLQKQLNGIKNETE